MEQQIIVIQPGYSFQKLILDGNSFALPLFIWFRNNTEIENYNTWHFQFDILQSNLYITVTLGKWPGDRYI